LKRHFSRATEYPELAGSARLSTLIHSPGRDPLLPLISSKRGSAKRLQAVINGLGWVAALPEFNRACATARSVLQSTPLLGIHGFCSQILKPIEKEEMGKEHKED
jgi:hypothetical protein